MALYVTRPRRDEVRIGRGLPSDTVQEIINSLLNTNENYQKIRKLSYVYKTP